MIKDQPYEEPDAGKPHVRFCEGRALRGVRLLYPGTKLGWRAVFAMTELFSAVAPGVAEKLGYEYSFEEEQSCMEFLEHVRNMPEDADEF